MRVLFIRSRRHISVNDFVSIDIPSLVGMYAVWLFVQTAQFTDKNTCTAACSSVEQRVGFGPFRERELHCQYELIITFLGLR